MPHADAQVPRVPHTTSSPDDRFRSPLSAICAVVPSPPPRAAVANPIAAVISRTNRATVPTSALPTKCKARRSPSLFPAPPLCARPSGKSRSSANIKSSIRSFWRSTRRSARRGPPKPTRSRPRKKNARSDPAGNRSRSKPARRKSVRRPSQERAHRFGSG